MNSISTAFDRNGGSLNSSLSWFEEDDLSRNMIPDNHSSDVPTESDGIQNEKDMDKYGDDMEMEEVDESCNRIVSERSIEVSMGNIPPRKRNPVMKCHTASTKTVYLIRHAESAENHRLACLARSLKNISKLRLPSSADFTASMQLIDIPAQIDSDVSPVGRKQIEQLASQLDADMFLETRKITLIVHSPLKRARQTCHGMLGYVTEVSKKGDQENRDPLTNAQKKGGKKGNLNKPRVVELNFLKERTPAEWLPYGNGKLAERIDEFEFWLNRQPEDVIAVVGHSQYFKFMLGLSFKFGNCDVWKFDYQPDANFVSKGMAATYSRRDDFENYDGPQIEACAGKGANIEDELSEQTLDSSIKGSKLKQSKVIPYRREESLKVDLPRGWSKMECLYKYKYKGG